MMHSLTGKRLTLEITLNWLYAALGTFAFHCAETEFERGYEQALKDMALELVGRTTEPLH